MAPSEIQRARLQGVIPTNVHTGNVRQRTRAAEIIVSASYAAGHCNAALITTQVSQEITSSAFCCSTCNSANLA